MPTQNEFMIFGIQRSGTTFLENLLTMNYHCVVANGSTWKHSLQVPITDVKSIAIIKSPYTWVESICFREPADLHRTSPEILEEDEVMIDNSYGECVINIRTLVDIYYNWFSAWHLSTATLIRYEDILYPQQQKEILDTLGFKPKNGPWQIPGNLFMSEGFKDEDLLYYQEQTPKHLTSEHIEIINDCLNDYFFSSTKYKKIITH